MLSKIEIEQKKMLGKNCNKTNDNLFSSISFESSFLCSIIAVIMVFWSILNCFGRSMHHTLKEF